MLILCQYEIGQGGTVCLPIGERLKNFIMQENTIEWIKNSTPDLLED